MTWRIDDLARTAGLTVDTVRYYQREGLLPPPVREGRHVLYGPEHLARLERVRELQARRFSLAAIRSLLDADRPDLVAGIFEQSDANYSFDDLAERSGLDHRVARALCDAGVLRDPADYGRSAYDTEDLDLCRAMADIAQAGIATETIVTIGRVYTDGIEHIERQVIELFRAAISEGDALDDTTLVAHAATLMPRLQRVVAYIHRRTLTRLTLAALSHPDER